MFLPVSIIFCLLRSGSLCVLYVFSNGSIIPTPKEMGMSV